MCLVIVDNGWCTSNDLSLAGVAEQCALSCQNCVTATENPCAGLADAGSFCLTVLVAGWCTNQAVTDRCAFSCAGCANPPDDTAVTGDPEIEATPGSVMIDDAAAVVYKGEFKHGYLPVTVSYAAPSTHTGLVDLLPIVRLESGAAATGVLDGGRTVTENAASISDQAASGTVELNLRFLSGAAAGGYTVSFVLKPSGMGYNDRFRTVEADTHSFDIRTEYIRVVNEDSAGLAFAAHVDTATDPRPVVGVSFGYLASTPVKFAIQIRCFVPPSERTGALANCDNFPRFFNTYAGASGPIESQFGAANIDAGGPTLVTLYAKLFSGVSRDPSVPYKIDVSMGTYEPADRSWAETRDRSDRFDLGFVAAAAAGSFSDEGLNAKAGGGESDKADDGSQGGTGTGNHAVVVIIGLGTAAAAAAFVVLSVSRRFRTRQANLVSSHDFSTRED